MDTPAPLPQSRRRRVAAWLYREALPLLLMLALLVVARSSFANHYHVPSGSMQPTREPGDRVVVDMLDGRLSINGEPMASAGDGDAERFGQRLAQLDLGDGGGPDIVEATVPEGHVLVLGDHRGRSADGRWFGFVEADAIYGRAVAVYWRRGEGPSWKRL